MKYENPQIAAVAKVLQERYPTLADKADILKAAELKSLFAQIPTLPADQRGSFGKELNLLRTELQSLVEAGRDETIALTAIDVTAPFAVNSPRNERPALLPTETGSKHPLMIERQIMLDIFYRMGFTASESREIDDDYHMFGSLNFPEGHPARDDYDTFMTEQTDGNGKKFIAPAHTSTMQNRLLRKYAGNLEKGEPIAVLVPDRVFRNEDLDARHEHTFYQYEGIYVDKGVNASMLVATLRTFLEEYYQTKLDVRINPFYFPFTEPSFEFSLSCPFCGAKTKDNGQKQGCSVCSQTGWIELLGCGMIHPNVLKAADIDPEIYSGFAWGGGVDRLVMMKHGIEDVRHFHAARLDFLRQFA